MLAPRAGLAALPGEVRDVVLGALLRRAGGRDYPGTAAERGRLAAAICAGEAFAGRTLAGAVIRRARRAESAAGAETLAFGPETTGSFRASGWFLPFAQYPQIRADGVTLTQTGSLPA